MRPLILALILFMFVTELSHAQTPTPAPGGGAIDVPQDDLPYDFSPFDYTPEGSEFAAFDFFENPFFVNTMGSAAITMFTFFDEWNVLGIFVVLLLAIWVLTRVHKFTTSSTPGGHVDINGLNLGNDEAPEEYETQRTYTSNPYRVYRQKMVRKK